MILFFCFFCHFVCVCRIEPSYFFIYMLWWSIVLLSMETCLSVYTQMFRICIRTHAYTLIPVIKKIHNDKYVIWQCHTYILYMRCIFIKTHTRWLCLCVQIFIYFCHQISVGKFELKFSRIEFMHTTKH